MELMCKESLEELDVEKLSAYQMHSYSLAAAAGRMMMRRVSAITMI